MSSFSSSVFFFSDDSLIFAILRVFVLYSHYGDSILSKKLNGHQAVKSMGLLGAIIITTHFIIVIITNK